MDERCAVSVWIGIWIMSPAEGTSDARTTLLKRSSVAGFWGFCSPSRSFRVLELSNLSKQWRPQA
jgi:hypothetical protein